MKLKTALPVMVDRPLPQIALAAVQEICLTPLPECHRIRAYHSLFLHKAHLSFFPQKIRHITRIFIRNDVSDIFCFVRRDPYDSSITLMMILSQLIPFKPLQFLQLLLSVLNSNGHGDGRADHGVVAHADQAHHLNVRGHGGGTGELCVRVHTAQGVGHAVGGGAGSHVVGMQGCDVGHIIQLFPRTSCRQNDRFSAHRNRKTLRFL